MVNLYDKTLAWTELGATLDVKGYLDDWGLRERVLPAALKEWTDDEGRLRAFPYFAANWPVAFNTGLLERAGIGSVPTTGDQLIGAARKLRAKGIAPVTVGGNDWTGQKLLAQIIQTFLTPKRPARSTRAATSAAAGSARASTTSPICGTPVSSPTRRKDSPRTP